MAMKLVLTDDPVLRAVVAPVSKKEFKTPKLKETLEQMARVLDAEPDGVALAAPQVGISKRIFIVRYDRMSPNHHEKREAEIGVFINPEFVRRSRRKEEMDEGCLSVRGHYGTTLRHERATVKAYDEHGIPFERGGGGILSQAFQHEMDHLNGTLFTDHATHLRTIEKEDHA